MNSDPLDPNDQRYDNYKMLARPITPSLNMPETDRPRSYSNSLKSSSSFRTNSSISPLLSRFEKYVFFSLFYFKNF